MQKTDSPKTKYQRMAPFFPQRTGKVLSILSDITQLHRTLHPHNIHLCEALTHRLQAPLMFRPWQEGDWFVGRAQLPPLGFTPQVYTKRGGFGYYCDEEQLDVLAQNAKLKELLLIADLKSYWKDRDSVTCTRALYPEKLSLLLPSDDWIGESGIAFPLYRMSGAQLDFKKLLTLGI